jgi:hypothetical protein
MLGGFGRTRRITGQVSVDGTLKEMAMTEKVAEKKIRVDGYLEYDRTRGVVYFFNEKGKDCLLRIEGVPPTAIEEGNQIDIHLVNPGGEHHHVSKPEGWSDGAICAVKLKGK